MDESTQEDIKAIAGILKGYRDIETFNAVSIVEAAIADYYHNKYATFDRDRFYRECGSHRDEIR